MAGRSPGSPGRREEAEECSVEEVRGDWVVDWGVQVARG